MSVRPRAADGEPDEAGLAASGEPHWILSFATDGAEGFEHYWFPDSRVLHGTLPNWSKGAVGQLKRALTQFKRKRDAEVVKTVPPSLADIETTHLARVALVEHDQHCLRFRVSDPEIYPTHDPFDLVFTGQVSFEGEPESEDVSLRIVDGPNGQRKYEFVGESLVPTEGRSYQAEILADGQPRVLFGAGVEQVRAHVIASQLSIERVPEA